MKNKTMILMTMLLTLFSITSFAQNAKGNKGNRKTVDTRVAERVAKMNSICNLSADQSTQISNLIATNIVKRQEAKTKFGKGTPELEKAHKEIQKSHRGQMKTILTPEQISKLKEYHKSQKAKGAKPGAGDDDLDVD